MNWARGRTYARLLAAMGLTVGSLVSACTSGQPEVYRIPGDFHFNFRWSASPGLDLTSDPAIITRAFVESSFIAEASGTASQYDDRGKYTYPGFARFATRPPDGVIPHIGGYILGPTSATTPTYGTVYAYLIELSRTRSGDWHALACTWINGVTQARGPNKYRTYDTNALDPHAISLDMAPPPAGQPTRTTAGSGSARFPVNDVFGGWTLMETAMTDKSNTGGEKGQYRDPCDLLPDIPLPPELRIRDYASYLGAEYPEPLPTLPPVPGWPADN